MPMRILYIIDRFEQNLRSICTTSLFFAHLLFFFKNLKYSAPNSQIYLIFSLSKAKNDLKFYKNMKGNSDDTWNIFTVFIVYMSEQRERRRL